MQSQVIDVTGLSSQQIAMLKEIITAFRAIAEDKLTHSSSEDLTEKDLSESAELYAEIYQEDQELQELTEAALKE